MSETRLALISFDGVNLLLPQDGIATIETSANVEQGTAVPGAVGTLKSAAGEWPAFALSADFRPHASRPESYKYCVAVNLDNEAAFSLLCEEVGTVAVADADELQPLQACMRAAGNPIESMILKDNRLMLVSRIESLRHYLVAEEAA
jgi:hypothetical protein